jgi:ketosteroid isomerase-like protein
MRRSLQILALACTVPFAAPAFVAAQPATDPTLAPIRALAAAFNANDDKAVARLFVPDAVVVDEVTPYRWTGPDAVRRWLHDDGSVITRNGVKNARITIGKPRYVHRSAAGIYTASPLVDSYTVGGRPQRETGLLILVLVKQGSAWKFSLLAFAKQGDSSDRSWQ